MQQQGQGEREAAIGVIGGSGLYEMEGFVQSEEKTVETPFGSPSDVLVGGALSGRKVWFLPRHGRGHRILPHEINHRANICLSGVRLGHVRFSENLRSHQQKLKSVAWQRLQY